jgi:uncharacterized protein YggE
MQNTYDYKKITFIAGSIALLSLTLLALVMSASEWKVMQRGGQTAASISVTGEGEITAAPDIATVTFTVRESAKTVPDAQTATETKTKTALAALAKLGIADKDIKTTSYTVNPTYENQMIYCITVPCPPGKTVVSGYEVSNTIQVKVRKIDQAGAVLGSLGLASITDVSGPNFTVDDMNKVQAEAKAKAIADAKEKAEKTAKALGVSLGAIVSFSEDTGGYYPMAYSARAVESKAMDSVSVPQGESVIKSHVTVVFSIN